MEDVHIYIIIGIGVAIVIAIAVIVSCCLWKRKVCKCNGKNDVENPATNEPNQEYHHELHSNTAFQSSTLELQNNAAIQASASELQRNTAIQTSTLEGYSNSHILQAVDTSNVMNRNRQTHTVVLVPEIIYDETTNLKNEQIRLKGGEHRRQQQDQKNLYRLQQENDLQGVQQHYAQQLGRQHNRNRNRGKRQRSQQQGRQQSQSNSRSRIDFPEKTIDLHYLSVRDAMQQFIAFVFQMGEIYLDNSFSRKDRFFYVITGRGKHSQGGIPKIKPAVQGYLDKHDYDHEWKNDGMVMIDLLSKKDLLSENLQLLY